MDRFPLAYHITFTCYGAKLHGDESGTVDPKHNLPGTPFIRHNPKLAAVKHNRMKQSPYEMDATRRHAVLEAIIETCVHQDWLLLAAHIRPKHAHVVVQGMAAPEKIMNYLKAYASRKLNQMAIDDPSRKRWARHGSTRYLWKQEDLETAVHYVVHEQGEPMEVYEYR
jgi:REP element-mobilizing transposase RayT